MICYSFTKPLYFIFSSDVPALLYYSHIPTAIVALLIGFFVFWKGKQFLINRLLFAIAGCFSLWVISNLILWTNIHSDFMLFAWSFLRVLSTLISILSIYFIYVFLEKKDVSLLLKSIFLILTVPIIILSPTHLNLSGFDITSCDAFAFEGSLFQFSRIFFGALAMIWIFALLVRKYRKAEVDFKKQILLMGVGMELFLFSFFMVTFLAAYLTDMGILSDSRIEFYGLFGMDIFIGLLAYLIVRYKAFNIKLLAAQALVIGIIILIASQFFFIRNTTNRILTAVTLSIVAVFGWWLVKSVKKEDRQNESLIKLNEIIIEQKDKIEHDKKVVEAANQELVKLDKAKTEFINIASHQLKTPISVIQGVASMMIEGDMDKMPLEQRQTFYNSVWQKTKKLKTIVHDILNATSFNDQKYSVMNSSAVMVNISKLLQQTIGDFEVETKERGIDLIFTAKENIPEVRGQKEYLEEAFINLINNAIKYTPSAVMTHDVRGKREKGAEKAVVAISVEKDPNNPKNILVKIKDNGIGIPKEAESKLFKRFSRAQNAVNMYTDGTGLGLFIVKEIIEGHHGKVWFESEVNKGTTFFVSLPTVTEGAVNIKEHIAENAATNGTT